jgi:ribosomal protein S18 acetylase RimI-like enzyme
MGTAIFMDITIRGIQESDLASVIELMRGFAKYEDLLEYCTVTEDRLRTAMFGSGGYVEGLIALDGVKAVGYALHYPSFASFRGERGVYLEDIYIDPEYRRHSVGIRMIRRIAADAASRGLERIDFLVLDWNDPAVAFYLQHGAEKNDDESHFKFAGEAFGRLSQPSGDP